MNDRREMRASDADREAVVARLSAAVSEGRLTLHEFDQRLVRTNQSVTYGDLAELYADLPLDGAVVEMRPTVVPARVLPDVAPVIFGLLPTWIRILWTIWLTIVSINLAVWLMVSLSSGELVYFWPMWVAVPTAAALFGLTVLIGLIRRGRRAADLRRSLRPKTRKYKYGR